MPARLLDQCMDKHIVLAIDLGASGGRAIVGSFDGEKITLQEVHRFSNDPVLCNGTLYWDVLRLFYEIKQGILKVRELGVTSIGVDTWGVDFGLLDKQGRLMENPIHYRDSRTLKMAEEAMKKIPQKELYDITGNQLMEINTLFQLLSLRTYRPEFLEQADTLLLMPDLFHYFLTGRKSTEYSIASTTQLMDAKDRAWSKTIFNKLNIPKGLMTPIHKSGTLLGPLSQELCEELKVKNIDVISVASHDTQSAMAAVPSTQEAFIFISCGTWSLVGTEENGPIINESSSCYNLTNEGGYDNKTSFLKNIIGLWLIQESRRHWQKEGMDLSFARLEELAKAEKPFMSFIDPDAPEFVAPGNLPNRIQEYCRKTNQYIPQSIGEIVRCIYESLVIKYRLAILEIEKCTGRKYADIHIIGGGAKSALLCQMTADACKRQVVAGPVEATVYGNVAVQLITLGAIENMTQAREIIKKAEDITSYFPEEQNNWDLAMKHYKRVHPEADRSS